MQFRTRIAASLALLLAAASRVDADEAVLQWTVATDASCGATSEDFAREVALACDALGHRCQIVRGREHADQRARLACEGDRAILEVEREPGTLAWTLPIEGDTPSRLRIAAMWLARAERDTPPPNAPLVKTVPPPPPAAKKTTPARASTAPATKAERTARAPREGSGGGDPEAVAADRSRAPGDRTNHGGLALSAHAAHLGDLAPETFGASLRAAIALPMRAHVSAAITGEQGTGAPEGYSLAAARAGAGVGWGAPWSDDAIGASLHGGALVGSVGAPAATSPSWRGFVLPYAELALVGAWPGRALFRPWIALSVMALAMPVRASEGARDVATLPMLSGALDVGVAWASW